MSEKTDEELFAEASDEDIEESLRVLAEEKKKREELAKKAELEGYTRRPKTFAVCLKCRTPYTEEEVRKWDVCPVCGNDRVEPVDK